MGLKETQRKITDSAIVMWFKRNPQVKAELKKEIIEKFKPEVVVSSATFEREGFETLPSVENFKRGLIGKKRSKAYIDECIMGLIRCCRGQFPKWGIDLVKEGKWVFKHPDRLDKEDVLNLLDLMMAKTVEFTAYKSLLKKGISVTSYDLPIGKTRGYGKLARLFVELPRITKCSNGLKAKTSRHIASMFMFLTGTRIDATLKIDIQPDVSEITFFDKRHTLQIPRRTPMEKIHSQYLEQGEATDGRLRSLSRRYEAEGLCSISVLQASITMTQRKHIFAR